MIGSNRTAQRQPGLSRKAIQRAVHCETLETRALFAATGTVTGVLYNDDNGSQVKEAGEAINAGRTVFIDANKNNKLDAGEKSTLTDSNGKYTFSGLAAGTYKVTRVLPDSTYQITTNEARYYTGQGVTVTAGKTTTLDIGSTAKGLMEFEISTDNKAANAQAYLDINKNGKYDSGDKLAYKTGGTSQYTIYSVAANPGSYRMAVTTPAGAQPDNNFSGYEDVTVTAGSPLLVAFHYSTQAPIAKISGVLWNDDNGNTQLDNGETINAGRTVFLDTNNNGKLDAGERSTLTDSTGHYTFNNVAIGEYHVRRVLPAGYQTTGIIDPVNIYAGTTDVTVDIGSTARAIVQGHIAYSGTPSSDGPGQDPSIDGVTVYADLNKNGKLDAGEPSGGSGQIQYDAPDGDYRFTLAPGTYQIRTNDLALKIDGTSSSFTTITVTAAQLLDIDWSKPFGGVPA